MIFSQQLHAHTQERVCVCVYVCERERVPHPTFALMIDIKGKRGAWKAKSRDPRLVSHMKTSF